MSKLSVTQIETKDAITPLTLITGNASAGFIKLEAANSSVSINDTFKIDASGRVGIGTTTPSTALMVRTATGNNVIKSESGSSFAAFERNAGSFQSTYDFYKTGDTLLTQIEVNDSSEYMIKSGLFLNETFKIDFNGNKILANGNVYINRTNSTVGQGVRLDVNGGINAASVLVNGAPIESGITTGKAIAMALVFGG